MVASRWAPLVVVAVLSACNARHLGPGPADSQLITEEEVLASPGTTAYEVINHLRPNFLSYRGESSFDKRTSRPYPNVYVDDQPFGTIAVLKSIPAGDVATVRLYRSSEATTKYGTGNPGGVIAISTRH